MRAAKLPTIYTARDARTVLGMSHKRFAEIVRIHGLGKRTAGGGFLLLTDDDLDFINSQRRPVGNPGKKAVP